MRIAIEAQRIFRGHKHGMDIVVLETIKQLQKLDKENEYFIFVSKGDDPCLGETENFRIVELNCPVYPLWEQCVLPHAVKKAKVDLLHCTSNTAPLWSPVPLVLTLHDIFFLEPEDEVSKSLYQRFGRYYRQWVVPRVLPHCQRVVTVSKNERKRILARGLVSPDKLSLIYNGFSDHFHPIEGWHNTTSQYTGTESYYLFFGNTDPRKNTRRVVEAFGRYIEQSVHKYPLIITGVSSKYVDSILNELSMIRFKSFFICPGYVPKEHLPLLYNGAKAFLTPSLKEGFGIPILESMACGTPVITSNVSAMPEVAGEKALLVDPTDCGAIADALLRIETDVELRRSLIDYGLERVKDFSWETSAQKWLALYDSIKFFH